MSQERRVCILKWSWSHLPQSHRKLERGRTVGPVLLCVGFCPSGEGFHLLTEQGLLKQRLFSNPQSRLQLLLKKQMGEAGGPGGNGLTAP